MPKPDPSAYAGLPDSVTVELRTSADRIRKLRQRETTSIIAIGCALIEAKDKLGHGRFGTWLASEFDMSIRTAENYMSVGETFGHKCEMVAHLAPTVLYLLASLDERHRAEVLDRLLLEEDTSTEHVEDVIDAVKAAIYDRELTDDDCAEAEATRARNKAAHARWKQRRREGKAQATVRLRAEPHDLHRLAKILELTASDSDGEALAAIRKANQELKRLGTTWTALLVPERRFGLWRRESG